MAFSYMVLELSSRKNFEMKHYERFTVVTLWSSRNPEVPAEGHGLSMVARATRDIEHQVTTCPSSVQRN